MATELNGTALARRISTSSLGWYPQRKSKPVIAIDFGTSTLAVAYGIPNEKGMKINCIKLNRAIVAAIGKVALREYCNKSNDVNEMIFFEKVKLELQHNQEVNRTSFVRGSNGKHYYLLEVIGLILKKLREKIENYFITRGSLYRIEEFDWVITVPALWGERARDVMREAAYVAGLCSNHPKWNELLKLPLQTVETHEPIEVKQLECNPERLTLVFEPEAAATWLKNLKFERVQDIGDITGPLTTDGCFLTVDIGGGTIDVTAHQVERDGRMKVHNLPYGRMCGGNSVNQAFKTFLGKEIVHDAEFETYLKCNSAKRHAELMTLLYKRFEDTKKDFGNLMDVDYFTVELYPSFVEVYMDQLCLLPEGLSSGVEVAFLKSSNQLQLSCAIMKQFMANCLEQIKECINTAIASIKSKSQVCIIYLVGGFGGCRYVTEDIRSYCGGRVSVIIPYEQELAVVQGACLYTREGVIRTADATYGTAAMIPYDESNKIHKQRKKIRGTDKRYYCQHLFLPFVKIGEELDPGFVYLTSYTPGTEEQTSITVHLFSTKEKDVHFVLDKKKGKYTEGVNHLGSINVDLSKGMALPRHKREVEIIFDFSSIEIVVYAIFVHTGERAQVLTDFLSTQEKIELL